jgi:uncharacterized integral membrane protein
MQRHDDDNLSGREERTSARPDGEATWTVRRTGPRPRLLLALALVIVLIVFAALNFRPVRVNFLLFTTRARVVTVIVVAAALGFVAGWFVGRPGRDERRYLRARRTHAGRDEGE